MKFYDKMGANIVSTLSANGSNAETLLTKFFCFRQVSIVVGFTKDYKT